mgnify:FL=1
MPILTINVAERGTPLYDFDDPFKQETSNVGHMWYSITDNQASLK